MSARKPLTDDEGEVRELTLEDMHGFLPASEALTPELYAGLLEINRQAKLRGRPNTAVTKERVTIRNNHPDK